jgi:nicotinamidase-related amidase
VPELVPADQEPVVEKIYGDAFEQTGLEAVLADLGVGSLLVAGARQMPASAAHCMVRSSGATT